MADTDNLNELFKRLRKVQQQRFMDVDPGQDVFSERTEESQDESGKFRSAVTDHLPLCTHGHAIRNVQELGGRCFCRRVLCKTCAETRCAIDGDIICQRHAESYREAVVCTRHGFWELLFFRPQVSERDVRRIGDGTQGSQR